LFTVFVNIIHQPISKVSRISEIIKSKPSVHTSRCKYPPKSYKLKLDKIILILFCETKGYLHTLSWHWYNPDTSRRQK